MDIIRKQIHSRLFGDGYTPPSSHRSIAPSSAGAEHCDELFNFSEFEEVDLIALQTTPEEFKEPDMDVGKFELQTVSANCTPEAIDELKELRLRQLNVRTTLPFCLFVSASMATEFEGQLIRAVQQGPSP
jgi:hypothetical protein